MTTMKGNKGIQTLPTMWMLDINNNKCSERSQSFRNLRPVLHGIIDIHGSLLPGALTVMKS